MRPPSSDEDFPAESLVPRQGDEKKKRKKAPSSPGLEKKKIKRRSVRSLKKILVLGCPHRTHSTG